MNDNDTPDRKTTGKNWERIARERIATDADRRWREAVEETRHDYHSELGDPNGDPLGEFLTLCYKFEEIAEWYVTDLGQIGALPVESRQRALINRMFALFSVFRDLAAKEVDHPTHDGAGIERARRYMTDAEVLLDEMAIEYGIDEIPGGGE